MKSQIQKKMWNCGITNINKHFFKKNYGVVLNWRTNDQIMPMFGRGFINDTCTFQ